jgi:RND superfamily putative drug exporter
VLTLARWSADHRRAVVVLWLAILVAALGATKAVGSHYANNFTLPGTGAQRASDLLQRGFPAQAGDVDQVVFRALHGTVTAPAARARIERVVRDVAQLPHVASVVSPFATHGQAISRDRTIAFATVNFDEKANALPVPSIRRVIATARNEAGPALQVELEGQAIEQAIGFSIGYTFLVGIGAAIAVLLLSFGSLLAMGLPVGTALLGLGTGFGLIGLVSRVVSMPDFATQLALMVGLGVGVDYALFVVTRFREAYRRNGGDVHGAVGEAINTAGRAVIFAGLTVVIALLGMVALGVSLLNGVAISAALAVFFVLAASLTLLPALLTFFGHRIGRPSLLARRRGTPPLDRSTFWTRWVDAIQHRPWTALVASAAVLVVLTLPVLSLHLGNTDAGNDPRNQTTRKAYDLLAQGFGQGFSGPLVVAVQLPRRGDAAGLSKLAASLRDTPGVAAVAPPRISPNGDVATVVAYPTTSPQSSQTVRLVQHLRRDVIPPLERRTGMVAWIGGTTAGQIDFSSVLGSRLPYFIAVVVLLSALLLLVVFRSLLIPLQAALMNLLSIGASMGIVVAVFQFGWAGSLLGISGGPIMAFLPVMVFAIVFGLSMDYEVFLVSRIHEEWTHGADTTAAVREGLIRTGRVITAAAGVMVVVFASFVGGGQRVIEMFGLALASAVFLDALVIRVLLLPATLQLLGERTWWFPEWLDRRLPRFALEPPEKAPVDETPPPVLTPSA